MKINQSELLARRREEIIARSAVQRRALQTQGQSLSKTLSAVDVGLDVLQRIKRHPGWVVGAIVGLIVLKPRRVLPLVEAGTVAWQAFRAVAPAWQRIMARRRTTGTSDSRSSR